MPNAIERLSRPLVMPQGGLVLALCLKARISRFAYCAKSGVSSFVGRCFVSHPLNALCYSPSCAKEERYSPTRHYSMLCGVKGIMRKWTTFVSTCIRYASSWKTIPGIPPIWKRLQVLGIGSANPVPLCNEKAFHIRYHELIFPLLEHAQHI